MIHTVRASSIEQCTQLARKTGITRDGLYKALSPTGNPSFAAVQKVVRALGYRLDVKAMPYSPSETNEGPPARINA